MKVAVIFLTCGREDLSLKVIAQNFYNSRYDAMIVWVDNGSNEESRAQISTAMATLNHVKIFLPENKGISTALNAGMRWAVENGFDAVITHANDILMPNGWLANMVETANKIPNTGMCGIHCVEALPTAKELNGVTIHPNFTAFGNVLIPKAAIDKIGYFNEAYDPYGMQDGDYAYRLNKEGFLNYYLHGMHSEHIGHDVGNGTEYRRIKDEALAKAQTTWDEYTKLYDETDDTYINYGDFIIDLKQFFGS